MLARLKAILVALKADATLGLLPDTTLVIVAVLLMQLEITIDPKRAAL